MPDMPSRRVYGINWDAMKGVDLVRSTEHYPFDCDPQKPERRAMREERIRLLERAGDCFVRAAFMGWLGSAFCIAATFLVNARMFWAAGAVSGGGACLMVGAIVALIRGRRLDRRIAKDFSDLD